MQLEEPYLQRGIHLHGHLYPQGQTLTRRTGFWTLLHGSNPGVKFQTLLLRLLLYLEQETLNFFFIVEWIIVSTEVLDTMDYT